MRSGVQAVGVLLLSAVTCESFNWSTVNLPAEHIPYFFFNNPAIKRACQNDHTCPYQGLVPLQRCWGYEPNCDEKMRMGVPNCPEQSTWVKSKAEQASMFWQQGDFGYVQRRISDMKTFCAPELDGDSSLACDPFTRHCRATNIYMDFRAHNFDVHDRFKENIFQGGRIGGHCNLSAADLKSQGQHKSALQSWFGELEDYTSLDFRPLSAARCDVVVDRLTYFLKLDAGINMYHHFCDFINLYGSQHIENNFSTDVNVVMWDTSRMGYGDYFSDTWKAFTDHPIIRLSDFASKKVCFKDAIFSMLPRQRFGLYYNMPLITGCYGSTLFRAFSQHVLHRLNVTQQLVQPGKIRVTLLSRKSQYRNILNEADLVGALKTVREYEVRSVQYSLDQLSFTDQLKVTQNSDIFIGMHGAGLTHGLFQPDWGVLMEIYNCEDDRCYQDLARLRGLKYMTWERRDKMVQQDEGHHPTLGAHAKFTNYWFDVVEFLRLVSKAADYIRGHPAYQLTVQQTATLSSKDEL